MSRHAYFKSQLIGFYFTINDCPVDVDVESDVYAAASKIHHQAYQLLEITLPNQPFWVKKDADNPEFEHFPYELCEESYETESHKGLMTFSYWLYSVQPVEQEDAKAMLMEIRTAYLATAAVLGFPLLEQLVVAALGLDALLGVRVDVHLHLARLVRLALLGGLFRSADLEFRSQIQSHFDQAQTQFLGFSLDLLQELDCHGNFRSQLVAIFLHLLQLGLEFTVLSDFLDIHKIHPLMRWVLTLAVPPVHV